MGNKDTYAKGLMLHYAVETVDWDNLNVDFLVLRIGQTALPLSPLTDVKDKKYTEFMGEAKLRGIPVIAWYELYPKIYGDTSWDKDDFSRWYAREQDMSMRVIDTMLLNRPYWHGMVVGVEPGQYNALSKTYDTSAAWVSRSLLRVKDLVAAAYPGKIIWPEFKSNVIGNSDWDPQNILVEDSTNWTRFCAYDETPEIQQVTGALDVNELTYTEDHMPMYNMQSRTGCLWRVKNVAWDGAKNAAGGIQPLPIYIHYGSKERLYEAIGFTASTDQNDDQDSDQNGDQDNDGDTGETASVDMTETNILLRELIDLIKPFFERFE
jgi:hypothetical protein